MPVKDAIAFLDDLKQPLTVYRASNPRAAVMHNRANSPFLLAWCEPCQSSRPLILVDVRVRFTIIEQRVSGYVCSVAQDRWARLLGYATNCHTASSPPNALTWADNTSVAGYWPRQKDTTNSRSGTILAIENAWFFESSRASDQSSRDPIVTVVKAIELGQKVMIGLALMLVYARAVPANAAGMPPCVDLIANYENVRF